MKIIATDNFDREMYSDQLICENISKAYGIKFVHLLNKEVTDNSQWYYKLVEDDYKLFVYDPNSY